MAYKENNSRVRFHLLVDLLEIDHVVGDEDHVVIDCVARHEMIAAPPQSPKAHYRQRRKTPLGSCVCQRGA